uniref:Uncharacterized protein n=1 Tax=Arundo donax TaxID=35708 RepID=A0A0A9AF65_ARUDO
MFRTENSVILCQPTAHKIATVHFDLVLSCEEFSRLV